MKRNFNSWTRRFFACIVCGVFAVSVYSVPAYRGWLTMEQPDGSTIQVRQVGDEFYHYMVNEAGQRIKQNADGYYVVAGEVPSPEVAEARRAASMARKNIRRAPKAVGTEPNLAPKGVVILVNFKDDAMQSGHTQAVFDELCNSTNCTVNKYNSKNYGSAAQYFADQSNGSYRPQFDVYGPVTLSRNVAYYGTDKDTGDPEEDEGDDQHATDAVVEACILANQQYSGLNFADYDSDGDGYVDFVYVIYAGKGQADGGAATTIWPHNWEIESAISYGYCTYTKAQCQIDGKKLNNYAMSGELSGSSLGGIGTLCHEFGHVMGLPDLYDTKYGTNYDNHVTPGDWNIMDGGSYNGDGHCPPNYDPWQKYFFGWVTPVNLATEGKNITLLPNGTEGYQSYQINSANKLQTATTAGVNYYIENRQKQGWDAFIPTSGMLVWKINFNSTAWSNNTPNNTAGSPKYTIVPADGKTSDYGAAGDTYPTSTVRSYTPISGHEITEITKSGNNITFKYNGGQQKTECSYELLGEHCTYPADGVVAYNAALSLTITPVAGYTLADPSCWTVEMGTNNELVYGEGFTYNAGTNEFRIEHVTDDVAIMAEGKAQVTLTWMSNGSQFAQTITAGSVVLPENEPEGCDGKVFVGWCATENYSSASVAPTFVKTGDEANQTTYYAVFATKGEGGGSSSIEKASSIAVGDEVILVCESKSMELSSFTTSGTIYGNGTAYSETPSGDFSFSVVAGNENGSYAFVRDGKYWNWSSGNSLSTATNLSANTSWAVSFSDGDASITNKSDASRKIQWNANSPRFACYTSGQTAVQLYKKVSGGSSYSDFTTTCSAPCEGELTGITLNTENVKKVFTEGEAFNYDGLVVTALYDGCDNKTVKPTSVSTPNMNQVGEQTITVTYEGKSAEYTINVTALPTYAIRFYNNGVQVGETQNVKQGQAATKPASDPEACEGYTFVGWYTEALAEDNTKAPSYVTDFTATQDQDYLAVFSKTEEGEGGSSTVDDQLTRETTGVSDGASTYSTWSGKTASSEAVYAGNSAGSNNSIQLRSNNSNSGIITTTSGGTIQKVTVSWNSSTASGRTLDIYGKNSAYSAATDLYNNSTQGTKLGSISDTQTELVIEGSYAYVGVRSNSGALYLDNITFTWETAGGSSSTTYYTTAPDCSTPEPCELISISIYTEDVKKVFTEGETFSYDGLVVIANYSNCASKEVTPTSVSTPDLSTAGDKTVTVSYTENEITRQKTYSITVKEPNQYTIAFYDNGVPIGDGQVVIEGKQPEVPSDPEPACSAYTFVGWWTAELAKDNTESKAWITDFTATQDQNYYAIYSKTTEGGLSNNYKKITTLDELTTGNYVVAGNGTKAMMNEIYNSYYFSTASVSPSSNNIISNPAASIIWNITRSSNTVSFYNENVNKYAYLYQSGKYYDLGLQSASYLFNVSVSGGNWTFEASDYSGQYMVYFIYNNSVHEFAAKPSSSNPIYLYKQESSSTTYYTSTVNCGGTTDVENASVEQVAVKALMNGQIVIIRGDAVYSITGVRIQ